VWTWGVFELLFRRLDRVAAFPTRNQGLDTARPRLASRTRWRLSALACAMQFLVFGHVGSSARPRSSGAVRSGEDRPCTHTLQACGNRPFFVQKPHGLSRVLITLLFYQQRYMERKRSASMAGTGMCLRAP